MDAARELAGLEFRVPVESLAPLPEGSYYRHDLIGCVVETPDGTAGRHGVRAWKARWATAVSWCRPSDGEVLIPLAATSARRSIPPAKRIVIVPPSGLLEVNEPRG